VSEQEGGTADGVASIHIGGVVFEGLIVPEPLRLFVGIDVASEPGEHGGVVDDLAFFRVHRETLGEVQRDEGLPEHMISGVTQSQIGTE